MVSPRIVIHLVAWRQFLDQEHEVRAWRSRPAFSLDLGEGDGIREAEAAGSCGIELRRRESCGERAPETNTGILWWLC